MWFWCALGEGFFFGCVGFPMGCPMGFFFNGAATSEMWALFLATVGYGVCGVPYGVSCGVMGAVGCPMGFARGCESGG